MRGEGSDTPEPATPTAATDAAATEATDATNVAPAGGGSTYAGYGDRPSRAWLRTSRQFVLIKALDGAVDPAAFALVAGLVAAAEGLASSREDGREQLMVRGIVLRGNGRATAYLDLLCTTSGAGPYLDLRAAQELLERRTWVLGAEPLNLTIKAQVVPQAEDGGGPLDDRFYERARLALGW